MKKIIISFILPLLILISCKKEMDQPLPDLEKETFNIKLTATGKIDTKESLAASAAAPVLDSLINQLTLVLHREDDRKEFLRMVQFKNSGSFGQFEVTVPRDNYLITLIGSKSSFGINQYYRPHNSNPILLPYSTAHMEYEQPTSLMGEKRNKTDDTFFISRLYTIDRNMDIDFELQRIVGKLEVVVEDVEEYTVTIPNDATGYLFSSQSSFGNSEEGHAKEVNNSDGPISVLVLRTDRALNIEISGAGRTKQMAVPIFKNQRTIVRGSLLAPSSKASFNVSVNTEWLPDSTEVIF
ncbi:FimB/Mfa2 family fimbrial subunit [Pedobacter immunditicola]|uniref:FimB/Mfa2 family fimbrial subunit n=1 Tax=Pedobacter immunditicola TaxID=3133440 RepID=UPI0030AF67B2